MRSDLGDSATHPSSIEQQYQKPSYKPLLLADNKHNIQQKQQQKSLLWRTLEEQPQLFGGHPIPSSVGGGGVSGGVML